MRSKYFCFSLASFFVASLAASLVVSLTGSSVVSSAAARAKGYTWSLAAARLRRLYADLTVGSLVDCAMA